ncbi:hypothetical protein KPH14_011648 [Odynerus spinipes]|uniref:MAGUK p55 subfamily member 5 n=1 Tax=Odynerus spinipes TaxID=1348599 RepID=A0AAD9VLT5_9HYME|nr:hypothetical protein KPH14_011648 [Odynerus spinipes]
MLGTLSEEAATYVALGVILQRNQPKELDGPNAVRIRDGWVIAVERGVRERLKELAALRSIQLRDIEAILDHQINESGASTSEDSTRKDVTSNQVTVTLADEDVRNTNAFFSKLSNGTIPKGVNKDGQDTREGKILQERKDAVDKQQTSPDETNLLQPVQSGKVGERRASSPFQNGRTEVLIGEPEGGPRSPRGSTSSAVNDGNFLNTPVKCEAIYRSRRRSGSTASEIHLQQQQQQQQTQQQQQQQQQTQLQENNNGSSRETGKKLQEGLAPDEMWAPGALGHHRELPVDVPDTLLQKAYPNKVKNCSPDYRNELRRPCSASELDLSLNVKNDILKKRTTDSAARLGLAADRVDVTDGPRSILLNGGGKPSMLEIELKIESREKEELEELVESKEKVVKMEKANGSILKTIDTKDPKSPFRDDRPCAEEEDEEEGSSEDANGQKESSVDVEDEYPFAKEDYPTMLKTCSDDSASPRSSSSRSDSTAPLDTSLVLRHSTEDKKNKSKKGNARGKDSPSYDARRIDLGSPCRPVVTELPIKVTPLFTRTRDTTSFDNPAYGLPDFQDIQGLLIRSDEVSDLTRLIDEQCPVTRMPTNLQSDPQSPQIETMAMLNSASSRKNSKRRQKDKFAVKVKNQEVEERVSATSTDDLLAIETSRNGLESSSARQRSKKKRHQQISSGYSTLRSEVSSDLEFTDRSFLVVGGKAYREVAVDCPPDFVPVTKCHPIYPPPNKTPGNSKHNTLEQKRENRSKETTMTMTASTLTTTTTTTTVTTATTSKTSTPTTTATTTATTTTTTTGNNLVTLDSPRLRSSDINLAMPNKAPIVASPPALATDVASARENVIARTIDRKHESKKVRSKVKSFLIESFSSIMHQDKPRRHHRKKLHLDASSTNLELRSNDLSLSNLTSRFGESSIRRYSTTFSSPSIDDLFAPKHDKNFRLSCIATFQNNYNDRDYIDDLPKILSFETDQNCRNSQRELSSKKETTIMDLLEDRAKSLLDLSPDTQNEKNARLSLEYEFQKRTKSRSFLDISELTSFAKPITRTISIELERIAVDRSNTPTKNSSPSSTFSILPPQPPTSASHFSRNPDDERRTDSTKDSTRLTPENSAYDDTLYAYQDHDDLCAPQAGLNGVKPAIPPRDQKRAPARPPKDSLRLSTQNNNVESNDYANTTEPTQQQLHSIRKYQEQLRKRKDEEERQEILNRSLRGSTKLQALESHATNLSGQENLAYAQDELTTTVSRPAHVAPQTPLTYGEVVATLERLQLQLRNISGALGISGPGVEAELEAVRTLLLRSRFATALATHHALKTRLRSSKVLKHHAEDASTLARDCVDVLEKWQSSSTATDVGTAETMAAVEELTGILTSYDMEALLLAHDSVVSYVEGFQRKHSPSSSSPSGPPSPTSSWRESRVDNIKIIRIEKTNEPLGATVRNDGDAVIIGRVVRGGAADKSGLLHEGDEVLEVNGVEMRGKSVNEVCDILAGMQGSLTFLVLPAPTNYRNNLNNRKEDTNQIQHIRAHFDYDPEEDPYIPCRELGVSFQKGDVLHVISQEDPNWWQAYREGEEDQTLAGLIPSKAFQHQRESMKQTIAGGKSTVRGSKKSSTLLCARKNPKKKKRNKLGANFNDDGYPLYATTAIDDYDSEEVLTYEEVALYYPRANHKRPIVLIGPPNIGRHELRQRLMQDSERFAAAIPHTSRPRKDSEVDGQDYHFISRSQFESDILCRKFVEHGEYEKAYYGTSVEAIRSVVNSGKICVLNLHPQSLKILRSSDLKPYVVFVAPPSLEKLRQKRIKNNESFKEEELKDIIEKAREMEDKYGHLFDMIIINNDTDRAYNQLLTEINSLEREPQWVPASWIQ